MRYPVDQRIVIPGLIPFGQPDSAARFGRHAGDDSANGVGTPVYAPSAGTVTPYTFGQYTGKVVEIFNGKYYPHVFHLSRIMVTPGQRVGEGELIGYSGSSGQGVTGPHVHFGVSKVSVPNTTSFNDYIDPLSLISDEGDDMIPDQKHLTILFQAISGRNPTRDEILGYVGKKSYTEMIDILIAQPDYKDTARRLDLGTVAERDKWQQQLEELQSSAVAKKLKQIKEILG